MILIIIYRIIGSPYVICLRCSNRAEESLLSDLDSNELATLIQLSPFKCDGPELMESSLLDDSSRGVFKTISEYCEVLRKYHSIFVSDPTASTHPSSIQSLPNTNNHPIILHIKRMLYNEAIQHQYNTFVKRVGQPSNANIFRAYQIEYKGMEDRLLARFRQIQKYEDKRILQYARSCINFDRIRYRMEEILRELQVQHQQKLEEQMQRLNVDQVIEERKVGEGQSDIDRTRDGVTGDVTGPSVAATGGDAVSGTAESGDASAARAAGRTDVDSESDVPPIANDVLFLTALLRWFKHDFFTWVNTPACKNNVSGDNGIAPARYCPGRPPDMENIGGSMPSLEERRDGWAEVTELYRCKLCGEVTRFPRYNNPVTLLSTRRGRCGEWANAFCFICRALSLDVYYVLDFTDHVWVEVFVPSLNRYVHMDPCEKALDKPLMYEAGWGKKLSYIFSISRYGIVDSVSRYTRKFDTDVHARRVMLFEQDLRSILKQRDAYFMQGYILMQSAQRANRQRVNAVGGGGGGVALAALASPSTTLTTESNTTNPLSTAVASASKGNRSAFDTMVEYQYSGTNSAEMMSRVTKDAYDELAEIGDGDLSVSTIELRKRIMKVDLEAMFLRTDHEWKMEELCGRISGSAEWKAQRGEDGRDAEWREGGRWKVSGGGALLGAEEKGIEDVENYYDIQLNVVRKIIKPEIRDDAKPDAEGSYV